MGRKPGSKNKAENTQGVEKAKKAEPAKVDDVEKAETPVEVVKLKEEKIEPNPLRKGDAFLFIVDGRDVYYTRSTANVMFQRNTRSIVIPKGSEYTPPKGSKCDGCG